MVRLDNTKNNGWTVLLTSAIKVSAPFTELRDEQERLQSTLRSIEWWRREKNVSCVVVCDGSGFDLTPYVPNVEEIEGMSRCEILNFENDQEKVRAFGKGYGEGEIIKHALANSSELKRVTYFAKCTAKLSLRNFTSCSKSFNGVHTFDYLGKYYPGLIDTRFYMVNKEIYLNKFSSCYTRVDDRNGYYLEHAFTDALRGQHFNSYAMSPPPKIIGRSGSSGTLYKANNLRHLFGRLRNFILQLLNPRL